MTSSLEEKFPNLRVVAYEVASPETQEYNCIAWAAGDTERWWWPDLMEQEYWPASVPRNDTIEIFILAFRTLGYERCETPEFEPGFEKIALYLNSAGRPRHAARQLPDGYWTSKLGDWQDINHATLDGLVCPDYGTPEVFLKRPARTD